MSNFAANIFIKQKKSMKKTLLGLAAALPLCGAMADEGMWTLYDLPQAVYEKMQIEGYQLP